VCFKIFSVKLHTHSIKAKRFARISTQIMNLPGIPTMGLKKRLSFLVTSLRRRLADWIYPCEDSLIIGRTLPVENEIAPEEMWQILVDPQEQNLARSG